MIVLFTDFGATGPYQGQLKAAIARADPAVPVIDLFCDAPMRDPRRSAYLLAAYAEAFPAGSVFVCVVDPGVGGPRAALWLEAGSRHFVGPDNGLLSRVRAGAGAATVHEIVWRPDRLSASFHGRDLFAPAAAAIHAGRPPAHRPWTGAMVGDDWPADLAQVVYVDHYGNAMTGIAAGRLPADAVLVAGGRRLRRAGSLSVGRDRGAFWYANANGLVEIAVNMGRADTALELVPGSAVAAAPAETAGA